MYTVIMVYQRLFTPYTLILDIQLYVLAQARPTNFDLHSLVLLSLTWIGILAEEVSGLVLRV